MEDKEYQTIIERIREMDSIMSRQSDKLDKISNMLNEIVDEINKISSKDKITNDAIANMNERYKTYDGPR